MKKMVMFATVMICSANLFAGGLTADEIVAKANQAAYYAGKDGLAEAKMVLSDGRKREFVILRMNVPNSLDQMFYVYFKNPADVRKMAYLVHKHPGKDDDRWLFLPALNLIKRIAPGDKRTSFVGSDFLYEDVSGRGIDEDAHNLIETNATQYVVQNVPKDKGSVEFSSYTVWIDKQTFMPVKAEYLDKSGKVYRRITSNKIEDVQGHPTALEQKVEDLSRGTSTVISFNKVKYDIGLKKRIFSERFLRRPPREVTR